MKTTYKLFVSYLIVFGAFAQDPIANLIQGRVVGIKAFLENNARPIEIYYGIPYAAPPTGRLRFAPPERHSGWKKTFYAHRMPPSCPQFQNGNNSYSSENCLYLNIWTSRQVDGRLQPVIVILYSDSWSGGSLNLPCQELAAEGVVVVTVAYRFHILSFFSLRSVISRGNLALLDQYMALLWIRENISAFGGDPTAVTLLGHSAGAESVLYHISSPRTIGLFNRAVIMSPRDIWKGLKEESVNAFQIENWSRSIAQSFGCLNSSDYDIVQCMRNKSLEDISKAFYKADNYGEQLLQPVSDDFLPESLQYIPFSLVTALKRLSTTTLPVDIMLGTTDLEALNLQDKRFQSFLKKTYEQIYNFTMNTVLPDILQSLSLRNSATLSLLEEAVYWEYWSSDLHLKKDRSSQHALEALATMDSAVNWGVGSSMLSEKLSNFVSRVYVYRYSYPSKVDLYGNRLNVSGAMRGTDLIALLGDAMMLQVARRPASIDEKQMSIIFRQYIVNFAKFGVPSSQNNWHRFTRNEKGIYEICDTSNRCSRNVERDVNFWTEYLPRLSKYIGNLNEYSERIVGDQGEIRFKGGMFAMCGVAVLLLLLLFASGVLLHRRRFYRPSSIDSQIAY